MGLPGGSTVADYGFNFQKQAPQDYKIWASEVRCVGDEAWLGSCKHAGWGQHECSHDQDVGICCDKAWERPLGLKAWQRPFALAASALPLL
jgi:hypothetical protein